ncbi:sulfite exporter TauE/SafE family protein [Aquibacillus albus]|uniref:Probable membrane transporter protein n=1 Tax=Aquibacillus albus TaxID=1168171 RepID=A0ABS2MW65_9BACI|nr:sulfite exporter TauE/SafE family protein [Aquibacillus albus]MBM7570122.1 putative membrane protein YfcA [Aquibacillus albus]
MIWIILIFVGFLGGTVGSLAGLGGGIIIVPSLIFLGGTSLLPELAPQIVVGISIVLLTVTGLSSTIAYIKQKKVDYRSGFIFFIGSGPGAVLGAILNKNIEMELFSIFFGVLMIVISLTMFVTKYLKPLEPKKGVKRSYLDEAGREYVYQFNPILAVVICFFIGMLSGLFGIGGGSLMVPAMLLLFRFPVPVAVATSMFMIFLSSITGALSHIQLGNVDWLYTLALVPGAWFGGKFGSYLNSKLNDNVIVLIFRFFLIIVGIRLILSSM